jgi:hypothetical protein
MPHQLRDNPLSTKVGTNFANMRQSLSVVRSRIKAKELLLLLW